MDGQFFAGFDLGEESIGEGEVALFHRSFGGGDAVAADIIAKAVEGFFESEDFGVELGQCLFRVCELAVQVGDFFFKRRAFGTVGLVTLRIGLIAPFFCQSDEFALGHFDKICAGWWSQGFGVRDFDFEWLIAENEPAEKSKKEEKYRDEGSRQPNFRLILDKEIHHQPSQRVPDQSIYMTHLGKWGSWRGEPRPTGLRGRGSGAFYRTFSVARPIIARMSEMIQKRITICGSAQPFFSKWWWIGAIRKMRFLVRL